MAVLTQPSHAWDYTFVFIITVPFIQVGPSAYFCMFLSYNHVHRLRLKKLFYLELFLGSGGGFISVTISAERPFREKIWSETVTNQ